MSKDEINELLLKKMIAGDDVSEQKEKAEKEVEVKSRRKKDYSSTYQAAGYKADFGRFY